MVILPVRGDWAKLGEIGMSCRDTIHLICMYLEGKLSPSVSRDIEEHLHDCANCKLVLKAATRTLDQYFEPVRNETTTQAA